MLFNRVNGECQVNNPICSQVGGMTRLKFIILFLEIVKILPETFEEDRRW
jgi:hypothetical protein